MTTAVTDELVADEDSTGDQPGAVGAGARFRAGRPARGLGGDRRRHRAGGADQDGEPRFAHRRRNPDLRREALRAAGLADAAQPRDRGQPRLRPRRASAGGQATDRDRRGAVRLHRAGLAVHRRGARNHHGGAGGADRAADQPLDARRRDRGAAGHRRRGQLRGGAHRAARRVSGVPGACRVRRADRRPRSGPRTSACRIHRRPHRRDGVGTATGCAVVAIRRWRATRISLWDKVVRAVLRGVLRVDVVGFRRGGPQAVPGTATVAGHSCAAICSQRPTRCC